VMAFQLLPVKLEPDHMRPFQVPPVQAAPAVRLAARVLVRWPGWSRSHAYTHR
jgi:hypothetical protein